ncbi:cytochrome P450 [Actinophytocola sp.]|uniref:cytochrome P450 n=1 Tax=Actinophytocola sp. TaxID=1872138 RepID=UPI003D6AE706
MSAPIRRFRTATGDEGWLVTAHAEVRRLLADERLGRAHPDPASAARTGDSALFGGPLGDFDTEHADHVRMRSLLQPYFTPKRMRALESRVDTLTTGLLDDLAAHGSPTDLVEAVAVPLPILVICELLGVPVEDRGEFRARTEQAADTRNRARSERGLASLFDYGRRLVASKRAEPDDGVIAQLSTTDGVTDDEAAMLAMALLFAGHETTVVQIGLGTMLLLSDRDQWRALIDDPHLVDGAVEETLRVRHTGGLGGVPRYARVDLEIDGADIRVGDLVLLDINAANHDPTAFAKAEHLDVTRYAAAHLTFGHGARYCIGAPLARVELRSVLTGLLSRFPGMRLAAPRSELTLRTGTLTGGLTALPVAW